MHSAEPDALNLPASHELHVAVPGCEEYLPAAHSVQVDAPAALFLPAAHAAFPKLAQ